MNLIVAGIAVKVPPGREKAVAHFFEDQLCMSVVGTTRGNIAIVVEADNAGQLEKMTNLWLEKNTSILSVSPVYIGFDDHEENYS